MVRSREERVAELMRRLSDAAPVSNGLLAFKLIAVNLNQIEDEELGKDHWFPPREFTAGGRSERLYPTYPENIVELPGYPGVVMLVHSKHVGFIGLTGAYQFQRKELECGLPYERRAHLVLLDKPDTQGRFVWDSQLASRAEIILGSQQK